MSAAQPDDPLVGATVGNYKIVGELGKGGMGAVYVAEHSLIGKKVAVKVLLPKFSANADIVQRFFNEAKAAAMIQHSGICEVFDFGKLPSGEGYIVMEFLQGESLTARLKRDGVVPFAELVGIARQVAAAVGAAHAKEIVHRDLKPDNVYLLPDEAMPFGVRVKVLDFGIAKLADDGEPDEVKTQAGELLGTPFYMSPEQCRGAGEVDARSDIYALGCILYQMATGTVPFDAKGTGALIAAHIYEDPPPPRTIDANLAPALEKVILRALAKDVKDRQQTMDALVDELEAASIPPRTTGVVATAAPSRAEPPKATSPAKPAQSAQSVQASQPTSPKPPPSSLPPLPPLASPARRNKMIGMVVAGVAAVAILIFAMRGKDRSAGKGAGGAAAIATDAAPVASVTPVDAAPLQPTADAAPLTCDAGDLAACVAIADRGALTDPAAAATLYKKACDGGVVDGCVRHGLAVERGRGVERDLSRAFAIYFEACDKKHADGCALLASMYEDGKGVNTDTSKAVALYSRACENGSGQGCTGSGVLHAMGQGVTIDAARAAGLFTRACELGDPVGCLRAGRAWQRGLGTAADAAKAKLTWVALQKELPPRCERGDARACEVLGIIRHQGLGAPADVSGAKLIERACELGFARACSESAAFAAMAAPNSAEKSRELVQKACDGGDDLGCALLARLLLQGGEVERALELYERACAAGGESGCADLAGLYDTGGPVQQDQARATTMFRRACDGGSFRGCLGLGVRLFEGTGGRKDERRARVSAEKACKLEPSACWLYARFLATGVGGAADVEQAKQLYTTACHAGEESACPFMNDPLPAPDAGPLPLRAPADAGTAAATP